MNRGRVKTRKIAAGVECKHSAKTRTRGSRDAERGWSSETLILEPIGDVMLPPSTAQDDMPLPDDVQLEALSFGRPLREQ